MRLSFIFLLIISIAPVHSQNEFTEFSNGLIYSNEAISFLSAIVGDKNEEFRNCDVTKDFKASTQGKGFYFEVKRFSRSDLKLSIAAGLTLDDFVKKYNVKKEGRQLFTKSDYTNYKKEKQVRIHWFPEDRSLTIPSDEFDNALKGKWLINKADKELRVIYLENGFEEQDLPNRYKRVLQYSECLIDTTTTVFKKDATKTGRFETSSKQDKKDAFFAFLSKEIGMEEPVMNYDEDFNEKELDAYYKKLSVFQEKRNSIIASKLSKTLEFKKFLDEACEEAIINGTSDDYFEEIVQEHKSLEAALELKRSRIVVGGCSMDMSPRIHALNISKLSAESRNWDVFLRAHLDIMNDKFQRVSDGNYAWGARNTYIKELEILNINVVDLILGISLRTSNPSSNHYFGNIRRLGRAIAESQDVALFEKEIVIGIQNEELDDYNRLLLFYLYSNLKYNLDINAKKDFGKKSVLDKRNLLPEYLQTVEI